MIPENFGIEGYHSRSGLGALPGIIHFSMSFRNAIRCGFMPTLSIFNAFARMGYDDLDVAEASLEVDKESVEDNKGECVDAVLTWPKFDLMPTEYDQLIRFIRTQYGPVEIEDFGATSYSQWFTRCQQ